MRNLAIKEALVKVRPDLVVEAKKIDRAIRKEEADKRRVMIFKAKRTKAIKSRLESVYELFWEAWVKHANTDKGTKDYGWRRAVHKELKPAVKNLVVKAVVLNHRETIHRDTLKEFETNLRYQDFKSAFELLDTYK